jgi:hypothetical protein
MLDIYKYFETSYYLAAGHVDMRYNLLASAHGGWQHSGQSWLFHPIFKAGCVGVRKTSISHFVCHLLEYRCGQEPSPKANWSTVPAYYKAEKPINILLIIFFSEL